MLDQTIHMIILIVIAGHERINSYLMERAYLVHPLRIDLSLKLHFSEVDVHFVPSVDKPIQSRRPMGIITSLAFPHRNRLL